MQLKPLLLGSLLLLAASASATSTTDGPSGEMPIVTLSAGQLAGFYEEGDFEAPIAAFRGIPYAAPPVGDLRWRPPLPAPAWEGIRQTDQFGARCVQRSVGGRNIEHVLEMQGVGWLTRKAIRVLAAFAGGPEMSEDCLTLNVQTGHLGNPDLAPVLVWIHGGGHQGGSSAQRPYQSTALVERGIVQVTINYRLGVFGFYAHPGLSAESPQGSSGNYGMLDQIAALQWVQQNIAAFGGDPRNVTIFGESAGGHSVGQLVSSPLAAGLFHKAIAMSGTGAHQLVHLSKEVGGIPSAESSGVEFAQRLLPDRGGESSSQIVEALRAISATDLLEASLTEIGGDSSLHPKVDGWCLPATPAEQFARGEAMAIPMIVGATADEGLLFQGPLALARPLFPEYAATDSGNDPGRPATASSRIDSVEAYTAAIRYAFADDADLILAHYPASDFELSLQRLFTDGYFGAPARWVAAEQSRRHRPTWLYRFTRTPSGQYARMGAIHGSDVAFIFGRPMPFGATQPYDEDLAETIGDYLVQFAKTGDPNLATRPAWPRYQAEQPQWQEWGASIGPQPVSLGDVYDAFDRRTWRLLGAKPN